MYVYVTGYGVCKFRATTLVMGDVDTIQLKGEYRLPDNVELCNGEKWVELNYYFTLDQILHKGTQSGIRNHTGSYSREYHRGYDDFINKRRDTPLPGTGIDESYAYYLGRLHAQTGIDKYFNNSKLEEELIDNISNFIPYVRAIAIKEGEKK
jgi:hypothetical protein